MAANSQETWWSAALLPSFICALKRLWLSLIFLSCFTFGFGWNYWHGHLFSHHHFAWCVLWSLLPLQSLQSYCIWSNSFPQGACPGPKDCCGFNSPLQCKSSTLFFCLRSVLLAHKRPDSFLRRLFLDSTYVSFVVCVLRWQSLVSPPPQ